MARFQGDLPERSFAFARMILSIVRTLPKDACGGAIGRQLARSGTSIGANVHEADVALTDPEFTHSCSIARKEASETLYWLRLCKADGLLTGAKLDAAITEADELLHILSAIVKKTERQRTRSR